MSSETNDLRGLLAKVALRDRGAFRQLYDRTSPKVFAVALKMLTNRPEAEDLVQDIYLKVWYSAEQYDPSRGAPEAWLVTMTRHRAIDLLRQRSVAVEQRGEEVAELSGISMDSGKLWDCLDALEAEQRQSIFAAFFQGLTHREIAFRFTQPVGTVKSRVRRGLMALKGCLEG